MTIYLTSHSSIVRDSASRNSKEGSPGLINQDHKQFTFKEIWFALAGGARGHCDWIMFLLLLGNMLWQK